MNGVLKEWIDKAEGDFIVALREYRARKMPNHDAVCFHAQQCIEKYLKAVLVKQRIPVRKTHDLVSLLQECLVNHPLWEAMRPDLEWLSQSAVKVRYPGESATREHAWRGGVALIFASPLISHRNVGMVKEHDFLRTPDDYPNRHRKGCK